jgi:outer membrane autotransporter protein
MNMAEFKRFAQKTGHRYALSTDFNDNIDQSLYMEQNKGVWVKPYTAFESIPLRHGPKVDSISYGTLIGGDTNLRQLANGWTNVGTLYIGYNGSQLDYAGVDTTTNGGLLGLTETFYKDNFFTAITATAGAGFAESHTMYGKEDTTFLMSGIASKTGYNIEFKNGKYILQPLLIANYSNVKVFDYTNAAGVDIKSDMAHNVQLVPTLKFIGNFENGWQPYASVGMVWNILHESNARANGIKLPEMYTKPYVQYGLGLQRRWGDKFTAYGQAMVRNGGRNGVALTAGFRWALGKDEPKDENEKNVKHIDNKKVSDSKPQPTEKVETQPVKKTVIKTLHPNKNVLRYKQLIGEK